ncbi:Anaphase-promoting complex subunit 23 [Thoreauomyces humboldtii]|nr:Anaphase-promoting complex subunit 23 [Thoreauomyces humboldtii]
MSLFWKLHVMAHRGLGGSALTETFAELKALFVESNELDLLCGAAYYKQGLYTQAIKFFEAYREEEPHSLTFADMHANSLFTMHKSERLSVLAEHCFRVDRYRPETCIVAGNFFSARRDHAQAIEFFQRALKLRPNYADALIMMGDEYLELKNSNAALEAYRRAADIAPYSFRTWYGLGKAFDMLSMSDLAIPYFQKATACDPSKAQVWTSLGEAYETSKSHSQAIMSYKRALMCENPSPLLLYYLASMYDRTDSPDTRDPDQAAFYYQCWVAEFNKPTSLSNKGNFTDKFEAAANFLAKYYNGKGDSKKAEQYANDIQHTEQGKALIRTIRATKGYTFRPALPADMPLGENAYGGAQSVTTPGPPAFNFSGRSEGEQPAWDSPMSLSSTPRNFTQPSTPIAAPVPGTPAALGGLAASARTSRANSREASDWGSPAVDDAR